MQAKQLKDAADYFGATTQAVEPKSPVTGIIQSLTAMAQAGLYDAALVNVRGNSTFADGSTYSDRFLADAGVLEDQATALNITTDQYGMIREEKSGTPGAWWLVPIGVLNHTVLASDDNGDRDAAIIFGSLLITMLAFPFIPYLNQLPDKLRVYKLIWRK